jgi:hypothetical protein
MRLTGARFSRSRISAERIAKMATIAPKTASATTISISE